MQIVDTRIRNLPTAVQNNAGEDIQRAAMLGYQHSEQRRGEGIAAQQQEAARQQEERMAKLRAELGMEAQRDAQGHALTMQGNQFGQERNILGTQQDYDRWKTQFGFEHDATQRGLDRGVQRYSIDQNVGVANRRLGWDQEYGRGQLGLRDREVDLAETKYRDDKTAAKQYRPVGPVDAVKALYPFGMPDGTDLDGAYNRLENLQRRALGMDPIGGTGLPNPFGVEAPVAPLDTAGADRAKIAARLRGMDPVIREKYLREHPELAAFVNGGR